MCVHVKIMCLSVCLCDSTGSKLTRNFSSFSYVSVVSLLFSLISVRSRLWVMTQLCCSSRNISKSHGQVKASAGATYSKYLSVCVHLKLFNDFGCTFWPPHSPTVHIIHLWKLIDYKNVHVLGVRTDQIYCIQRSLFCSTKLHICVPQYIVTSLSLFFFFNFSALNSSLCNLLDSSMCSQSRLFSFHSLELGESFQPISSDSNSLQHESAGGHVKKIYSFESQIHPHVLSHPPGLWPPHSVAKGFIGG